MSLTVSDITSAPAPGTTPSASTSLAISSVSASVGEWLVVMLACDNAATSGTSPIDSISDTGGNTWTQRVNRNRTNGNTINDGVSIRSWTSAITTQIISGTITITFTTNTTAKIALLKKITPASGFVVAYGTTGGADGNSGTPSATTSSITNGHTVIAFVGDEHRGAVTADSDTTNGTWSTQQTAVADTTSNATSIRIASQHKTVTATATQTYNVSINSTDWSVGWMTFAPELAPSSGMLLGGRRNRLVIA